MMNVLFVCAGNVARSQVAEALFNRDSGHRASSAGTLVTELKAEGQTLREHADDADAPPQAGFVIALMAERGIDVSGCTRKQLTQGMVDEADQVVVMAAEKTWPGFLRTSGKVRYWEIKDPIWDSMDETRFRLDQVAERVAALVEEYAS